MALQQGDQAPDFQLPDQIGKVHSLSDFHGKKVLIYFYPRDDTPGCTTEACALRDSFKQFQQAKVVILGVSTDGVKSHEKFSKKFELPFLLLADEKKEVVNLYHVWGKKKFMGREFMGTKRVSFLIDENGKIMRIYDPVKPEQHAKDVLHDVTLSIPEIFF